MSEGAGAVDRNSATLGFDAKGSASASASPSPGGSLGGSAESRPFGSYELLNEIARGGMGVVYKARQVSLNRTVAVKMILGGQLATSADVQRFRAEAEAAANLHHPNIVAIHEVGEHAGQHYFSMDYVAGRSLAGLVRESPLPAHRAATYVQKIAQAIHYAHGHLILHRDLKPSNVLVDEYDEPRVTDFGLAKRLEDQSGMTASGAVLGTPSYMPPEQAAGEHRRLGPASDVYSLGAILYELVTGRPPFRAESPIETLRQVLDAEPAAPRLLNPRVDRDIETICLKCLHKDADRRYATAQELADDLGRYLRGEPIVARPVGQAERLWRWCRRNPRVAALAAVVLLLLVAVAGVSTAAAVLIAQEQKQTDAARAEAHENFLKAQGQFRRAELNFQKARDAVNQMLTRVGDELLADLPQTEPVRRAVLEDALDFYRGFLEQKAADPEVQHETGLAYHRVGEITRLLGKTDDSKEAYEQAIALLGDLARRFPDKPQYARDLAESQNWLGELLRTSGQPLEASEAYRQAVHVQTNLTDSFDLPAYSRELARSHYNLGIVLREMGRQQEAADAYDQAIRRLTALRDADRNEPNYRLELARCLINRGVLLKDTRQFADAERSYVEAIALLDELVNDEPTKALYRFVLAASLNNLGNLLLLLRDPARYDDAEGHYRRAFELFQKLVTDSPSVPSYRNELANSSNSLASLQYRNQKQAEAETTWRRGLVIAEKLADENPSVPGYQFVLGGILGNLGAAVLDRDQIDEGCALLERAVTHEYAALEINEKNPAYRQFARTDCLRLARAQVRRGDHAKAARAVEQGTRLAESWQDFQRNAYVMADCVTLASSDETKSEAERRQRADEYAVQAVALLREAVARGFKDDDLPNAAALEPLRSRPEFQQLLAEMQR